jgi:hypothetical protein
VSFALLSWLICFPSLPVSDFILTLTPACSVFKVVNFSFRLSTTPSRRLSSTYPVEHQTVWCAHRQQTPQRLWKWLRAINTPNHLIHNHPSIPNISFNTRAKDSTPRHIKQIESSLSLQNQLNSIRDLREGFLVFFVALVAWLGLFIFNSYSQVLC